MMNRSDDPMVRAELAIMEYRLERIEQLLAEEVLSAEMEAQLRHTMSVVEARIRAERAGRFHDLPRRAAA